LTTYYRAKRAADAIAGAIHFHRNKTVELLAKCLDHVFGMVLFTGIAEIDKKNA
jgi:hypothetical protein